MTVTLRPVAPDRDASTLTGWVTAPGAGFWGMSDHTEDEVAAVYRYIDERPHLAAYLLHADDHPVGLLQTYDPAVDEIGEWYPRRDGDLGVHYLLADTPARAGRTPAILAACLDFLVGLPGTTRLVHEPDARNARSLALLERLGAERGPLVDLRTSISAKPAQFYYLSVAQARATAAALRAEGERTRWDGRGETPGEAVRPVRA